MIGLSVSVESYLQLIEGLRSSVLGHSRLISAKSFSHSQILTLLTSFPINCTYIGLSQFIFQICLPLSIFATALEHICRYDNSGG